MAKRIAMHILGLGVLAGLVPAGAWAQEKPAARSRPATEPAGRPADARPVIKVKTAEQFVAALAPNRVVELEPGEYVLSKVKRGKLAHVHWQEAMDKQYELVVRNVPNLGIRGLGSKPVSVLTEHPYAFVLSFRNAPNLALSNLKLGHAPDAGYCSGGVVSVDEANRVTIAGCILYGCGTEGLALRKVQGLVFSQSVIEDCTYGILTANDCRDLHFRKSVFRNNAKFHGFALIDCTGVTFVDCLIRDNLLGALRDPLFKINLQTDDAKVRLTGGRIIDNAGASLCNEKGMVVLDKTAESNNSWQAAAEVIKARGTKVAAPGGGWTYHTDIGETDLWDVAVSVYGNGRYRALLAQANPGLPKKLRPDTRIICPPPSRQPPKDR
ncbi:MAG TPA: right-handed parallel beta-helix repeat-containing protein [Phycisphaerae bacterium]|nr:right-handed parallel beta-helix repeat-containing protein [Phycisphaerae bacterium]